MSRYSVLVAEPERAQQQIIEMLLSVQDCDVIPVADAGEALGHLRNSTPDLVIVAAGLPQMNGFDITRKLRSVRRLRDVPVLITGAADANTGQARAEAAAAGADLYLTRPLGDKNLASRALALIGGRSRDRDSVAGGSVAAATAGMVSAPDSPGFAARTAEEAGGIPILQAVVELEEKVSRLEQENRELRSELEQERRVGRNRAASGEDVASLRRRLKEAEHELDALKKERADAGETNPLKLPIGQLFRRG